MSEFQQIKDYIYYTTRPFKSNELIKELGINYSTINKALRKLISEGFIKQIGNDGRRIVYIINKNQYRVGRQSFNNESVIKRYHRQLLKPSKQVNDKSQKTGELIDNEINTSLKMALQQSLKDYTSDPNNEDLTKLINLLKQVHEEFQKENKRSNICQIIKI